MYFIEENNLTNSNENNKEIDIMETQSLYDSKLNVAKIGKLISVQYSQRKKTKNYIETNIENINKNNKNVDFSINDFKKITTRFKNRGEFTSRACLEIKFIQQRDNLIIKYKNEFIYYNMMTKKILDYMDMEICIENIQNLSIIYPINKHQYFLIFDLKDYKNINKSYNKLIESNHGCYWTIISETLSVKYYEDVYFRFK